MKNCVRIIAVLSLIILLSYLNDVYSDGYIPIKDTNFDEKVLHKISENYTMLIRDGLFGILDETDDNIILKLDHGFDSTKDFECFICVDYRNTQNDYQKEWRYIRHGFFGITSGLYPIFYTETCFRAGCDNCVIILLEYGTSMDNNLASSINNAISKILE